MSNVKINSIKQNTMPSQRKRVLIRNKKAVTISQQYLMRVFHWLASNTFISSDTTKSKNVFEVTKEWQKPIYKIRFDYKEDARELFIFAKMLDKK